MLPSDPKKLPPHKATADANGDHFSLPLPGHAEAVTFSGAAEPPSALSAAPSLGTLLHAFRRCWKLAVPLALLGGVLAAGAAWLLSPKEYTSTIDFRIQTRPPQGSLENEDNFANVQKAQVARMKSSEILGEAIQKSRAAELYGVEFNPQKLQKKMTVSFNDGPEIAVVSLSGPHPEAVAALLNALGEVYPRKVAEEDEARLKTRIAQLRARTVVRPGWKAAGLAPNLAEELMELRSQLNKAKRDAGLFDAEALQELHRATLDKAQKADNLALTQRQTWMSLDGELLAKEKSLRNMPLPEVGDSDAELAAKDNLTYQRVLKELEVAQQELDNYKRVANLSRASAQQKVEELKRAVQNKERERTSLLEDERRKAARRLQTKAAEEDRKKIAELRTMIEAAKQKEADANADARKWETKAAELRRNGPQAPPNVLALDDKVVMKTDEMKALGGLLASLEAAWPLSPRVTCHAEAYVPSEMDLGKPIKFSLAGGVSVFGLLLAGMCLLEARGRRVSASEDVMSGLGMRIVGSLPRLPAAARLKAGIEATPSETDSQYGLTEAVDAIRTVLLHAPRNDGARVVMVTSAVGGEGKTTLSSHLAASLARAWRKTLLIDGDLRNPAQHIQLNQPLEPGLSEALRGEVDYEETIRPTLVSRLWLMPAGKVDGHSLQALAQDGVATVFERLADQYDFIVIDTSPVLPVPDALLLGKQADVVLLSVMRDVSRLPAVYAAQQRLESLGIRILGAVVIGEKTETYGRAVPYPRPGA